MIILFWRILFKFSIAVVCILLFVLGEVCFSLANSSFLAWILRLALLAQDDSNSTLCHPEPCAEFISVSFRGLQFINKLQILK